MSPIANILTRIRNAQSRGQEEVVLPFSKMMFGVVRILEDKGFISGFEKKTRKAKKSEQSFLDIKLKYDKGVGAINGIKLISKPSRRIYAGKGDLRPAKEGYGVSIVSTSKGLMTDGEARKAGVGGEVLFEIW